jgi:Mrp family chromosome partitioning ATPase
MEIMSAAGNLSRQIAPTRAPSALGITPAEVPLPQFRPIVPSQPEATMPPVFASLIAGASAQANLELLRQSASHDSYGLMAAAGQIANWALARHNASAMHQLAVLSLGGGPADSSMAVVAVARAMASKNARVVVVDLVASGSHVDMLFGLPPGPGFVDLMAGTADFTKVIVRDPSSSAHLLRFGFERREQSMTLLSQRTDAVLIALGKIYDVVIVHAGEAAASTPALVAKCQAALLLAPAKRQGEVAKAARALAMEGQVAVQFVKLEPWNRSPVKLTASA